MTKPKKMEVPKELLKKESRPMTPNRQIKVGGGPIPIKHSKVVHLGTTEYGESKE